MHLGTKLIHLNRVKLVESRPREVKISPRLLCLPLKKCPRLSIGIPVSGRLKSKLGRKDPWIVLGSHRSVHQSREFRWWLESSPSTELLTGEELIPSGNLGDSGLFFMIDVIVCLQHSCEDVIPKCCVSIKLCFVRMIYDTIAGCLRQFKRTYFRYLPARLWYPQHS